MISDPRVGHSLFLGGTLTAMGLYFPPPGPVALWLLRYPIPLGLPPGFLAFLLSWLAVLTVLSGIIYLFLRYSLPVLDADLSAPVARFLDRAAIGALDVVGLGVGIAAIAGLPWYSVHYLPLGLSLVIGFGALVTLDPLPRSMGEPPPEIRPAAVEGEDLARLTYSWSFDCDIGLERPARHSQFLDLLVDLNSYRAFQARNPSKERHPGPGDLAELVANGASPEVEQVAAAVRLTTRTHGYCAYVEVLNATGFVQSPEAIPYVSDQESKGIPEYWRYPLETLADRAGDCECKSILAGSLLRLLDRQVLFLIYPPKDDLPGHMAIAIQGAESFPPGLYFFPHKGGRYFYCELTAEAWRPGEVPARYRGVAPEVYVV